MYDLGKTIDEFTDELFTDVGLINLPEEKKAEIFARVQDHLHEALLDLLSPVLQDHEWQKVNTALEQEDYGSVAKVLKRYPRHKSEIEKKLETEMQNLKLTITEEQQNEQRNSGP